MTIRKNGTKQKPTQDDQDSLRTTAANRDKLAEEGSEDNAEARNATED